METPLVPDSLSPKAKLGVKITIGALISFVLVTIILAIIDGAKPGQTGMFVVAIALAMFLICIVILLNWLRQDKLEVDRVKWIAITQSIGLVILCCALMAIIYAPPEADQYSLGGSATGVSLGGLQLNLNGDVEVLSIAATGYCDSFKFKTKLNDGDKFTVGIKSTPSDMECSLANSIGTINDNISPVRLSCLRTWTIQGTVSGLTKDGLVLMNTVTPVAPGFPDYAPINATAKGFAFRQGVPDGSQYAITPFQQPSGQKCDVIQGQDTATGPVTNVIVTCQNAFDYDYDTDTDEFTP